MSKKEKKEKKVKGEVLQEEIHLDIPEDEIWTYQVEGLAAPHINKPYKHYNLKKAIFVITIIVAVSLSIYFSVMALQNDTFEYNQIENGYEFSHFANTGYLYELEIDYVSDIEYIAGNNNPATNFKVVKDTTKPIKAVRQFTLNCDDKITTIRIGPDVEFVDEKAFYSCWALQNIEVDENNPNYCDVDGVLYNKDKTELLCYPCDHDEYLRQKYSYEAELFTADITPEYEKDIQTYVVPSSVTRIGVMAFNYANLRAIYLPEGLKTIETLSVFKLHERKNEWETTPSLHSIYTYKADNVSDSHFTSEEALGDIYLSLPETLEFIGSDAFSYNQNLQYVYIPESVKYIGHHAFWDTCYKVGGEIKGVAEMNVAVDEATFETLEVGDDWIPKYDYLLFKKAINVNYSVERQPVK
ncbi:MAG: leucine-rich repeat protein [Clostridia bacterium]|nr:leucine-rich repeat protein [Clostridia bacterium]